MTLLICLCWQEGGQGGLSWNDLSSHRLVWAASAVPFKFQRSTREASPQGTCTYQAFAAVRFAFVLLAKASHMIKTRANAGDPIQTCEYREMCNIVGHSSNNLPDQTSMRVLFSHWVFSFHVPL